MRWLFLGLALCLGSCATLESHETTDHAQCVAWGAPEGSPDYASCRASLSAKRSADSAASNARILRALSGLSTQTPVQTGASTTCFKRGETTSGMNKICHYDCLGSAYAVTQSAVSLCDLTVRR